MSLSTAFNQGTTPSGDPNLIGTLGANIRKQLDNQLAQPEPDELDSECIKSVVICNDINIEEEMSKVLDDDEGAFKMLSISFYDKKSRQGAQKSQTLLEETHNFSLRPDSKFVQNYGLPSKPGSQTTLYQYGSETSTIASAKDMKVEQIKSSFKSNVKLFSIRERANGLNLSPQPTSQKSQPCVSLLMSPSEKANSQTTIKEPSKQDLPDKILSKVLKSTATPLKTSIPRSPTNEKRVNTVDLKINSMFKAKSPNHKPPSKDRVFFETPKMCAFSLLAEGNERKSSTVGKSKLLRESSSKRVLSRKLTVEKEESPPRSCSPANLSLTKALLINKFDVQKINLNQTHTPTPNSKEIINRESKALAKPSEKNRDIFVKAEQMKIGIPKGSRPGQFFYTTDASRRGSNCEQKPSKLLLNQKLRLQTEEDSVSRLSIKDSMDISLNVQVPRTVKAKTKAIDLSCFKHRESIPLLGEKAIHEPTRLNTAMNSIKSRPKVGTKEKKKEADLVKQNNFTLALQGRFFDM